MSAGQLTLGTGAQLYTNVFGGGNPTSGFDWSPIVYSGGRSGTLTFKSGDKFTIAYNGSGATGSIDVTAI